MHPLKTLASIGIALLAGIALYRFWIREPGRSGVRFPADSVRLAATAFWSVLSLGISAIEFVLVGGLLLGGTIAVTIHSCIPARLYPVMHPIERLPAAGAQEKGRYTGGA